MPTRSHPHKPDPEKTDEENPEWTDEMFARARPAADVLGEGFMEMARKPGRPRLAAPKVEVKIRLDAKMTEHLRASGKGWQTRVNAALLKLVEDGGL